MEQKLGRRAASEAVSDQGWRFLLGTLCASVPVGSLARAAEVAALAVAVCGSDADAHLRVDIRPRRVFLSLQSLAQAALTARDVDLAHRLSAALHEIGLRTEPDLDAGAPRSVQLLETSTSTSRFRTTRRPGG